jgi:hypothetical protein
VVEADLEFQQLQVESAAAVAEVLLMAQQTLVEAAEAVADWAVLEL